jgi:aminocarboxymuconate-semialdehyde decarboxylase
LCAKEKDHFPGWVAQISLDAPDAGVREAERAIKELGALGVQIYTNVAGKPLDAPELLPLFAEAARRDIPMWMHPARGADFSDYQSETRSQYEIWWTFGWPYETSVAMARFVFSGYFDKFPNLKIITHHMGGMVPYFEGRVGYGWDQLGTRTSDMNYAALLASMKKRPVDYFRQFYADTALFGAAPATRCGFEFFGVDRVVFASDMPFEPAPGLYARETIRCVEALGLGAAQKAQIYRGNAEKLLKRTIPA